MLTASSPQPVSTESRLTSESSGDPDVIMRQFKSVPSLGVDDLKFGAEKAAFVLPRG